MKKLTSKLLLVTMTMLLILSLNSSRVVFSVDVDDVLGDVNSSTIDIIKISKESSNIAISTDTSILSIKEGLIASFFILFDSDNDDNKWEAAIVYSYASTGAYSIHWTVEDLSSDTDWRTEMGTNSYYIESNTLNLVFNEFPDILTSNFVVISIEFTSGSDDLIVDWAPDSYSSKITKSDISKMRPVTSFGNNPTSPGTTTTSTVGTSSTSTVGTNSTSTVGTNSTSTAGTSSTSTVGTNSTSTSGKSSQPDSSSSMDSNMSSSKKDNSTVDNSTSGVSSDNAGNISTSDFVTLSVVSVSFAVLIIKRKFN